MSLSEFTKLGKRKGERAPHVSTLLSHGRSDSECLELAWQNGQIMTQGQSSKTIEGPVPNDAPLFISKPLHQRDPRITKFSTLDPVLNGFPLSAPSYEMSLDREDDTVSWLNCPLVEEGSLACTEKRRSSNHLTDFPCSNSTADASHVQQGSTSKDLSGVTELNKLRLSETCPLPRSRNSEIAQCQSGAAKDSMASKLHKFDAGQSSNSSGLMNFSYFSRFASIPVANNVKLTPDPLPPEQSEATCMRDGKNDTLLDQSLNKAVASGEKAPEPAMATSSVCSANRLDRVSNDHELRLKRKSPETGDSESRSDEAEDESVGFEKTDRGRKGSKRSRASEVHNLSERRRRERINEKMRALQDLLPNCNKVDKASMLDEAIEYLKALQLQVQVLSMGAGVCVPPMMLPAAVQSMHRAHVSQFSPVGMGMGMGMGFGMGMNDLTYSMAQMPGTQGPCYPVGGPQVATSSTFHGAVGSGHQGLGHLSQELPISTPCSPLPFSGSPHVRLPGVVDLPLLVPSATSREVVENIGSQVIPSDQANKTSRDSN